MVVKLSSNLWDHLPTLQELREHTDPDKDRVVAKFNDEVDVSLYINYTGLRIYSNGRKGRKGETTIKVDMKYIIYDDGSLDFPDYEIDESSPRILV